MKNPDWTFIKKIVEERLSTFRIVKDSFNAEADIVQLDQELMSLLSRAGDLGNQQMTKALTFKIKKKSLLSCHSKIKNNKFKAGIALMDMIGLERLEIDPFV